MAGQWITTIGLVFDIAGASFLAWGLFVSKRTALDLGLPAWAGEADEENLKMPTVADRLRQSRNAKIGLPLLLFGFLLQIVGTWA